MSFESCFVKLFHALTDSALWWKLTTEATIMTYSPLDLQVSWGIRNPGGRPWTLVFGHHHVCMLFSSLLCLGCVADHTVPGLTVDRFPTSLFCSSGVLSTLNFIYPLRKSVEVASPEGVSSFSPGQ